MRRARLAWVSTWKVRVCPCVCVVCVPVCGVCGACVRACGVRAGLCTYVACVACAWVCVSPYHTRLPLLAVCLLKTHSTRDPKPESRASPFCFAGAEAQRVKAVSAVAQGG